MSWMVRWLILGIISVCVIPVQAGAEEQVQAEQPLVEQLPAEQPPVETPVKAPPPPLLKPISITFFGKSKKVDRSVNPIVMTMQDRYGVQKKIYVPSSVKLLDGKQQVKALDHLEGGLDLTVEYTYDVATGKRTATTIITGDRR